MNASEFKKLSNRYLAPKLREKGWKGTGFNFYKTTDNNIIQIFGIQGSPYGGSICCETAIHFDFIPDLTGKIEPSKISYVSCLVRRRLSPKGEGDYHWRLSTNEDENIKSLNQIYEALMTFGEKFYKDFEKFPYPFDEIKPQNFLSEKQVVLLNKYYVYNEFNFLWLLKEINIRIGRDEIAKEFSMIGIEKATKFYDRLIAGTRSKKLKEETQNQLDYLIKRLKV